MPEATGDVTILPPVHSPTAALATTWNARRHLKLNLNLASCHHNAGFYSTPALGGRGPSPGAGSASTVSHPCSPASRPTQLCVGMSAEEVQISSKKSKLDYGNSPLTFSTPASSLPGHPNHVTMCHNHQSHLLITQQALVDVNSGPHHQQSGHIKNGFSSQHNHHHNKTSSNNKNNTALSPTTAFINNILGAPNSPLPSPVVNNCGCGIVCRAIPTCHPPPNTPNHSPFKHVPAKLKSISPLELSCHIDKSRPMLLIDVRSAHSYHQNHIQGSVNLCTTDRFNRRRITSGKSSVFDILGLRDSNSPLSAMPSTSPSPSFKRKASSASVTRNGLDLSTGLDIVVYDEHSSLTDLVAPVIGNWSIGESALCTVLLALLREGRDVHVLDGGLKSFLLDYEEMTRSSFLPFDPSRPMLYSPTNGVQEPEIEAATATQVLPFLYLGNERDAKDLSRLRSLDIRYVLNVTSHVPQYFDAHGIRYKRIPASDSTQQNLKQYFEEAIEYIDDALQNHARVLIHCHAGVSRSATVTIAYLLKHTRMAMADAYKFVKGKRSIISPNFNFMGQLLEFEQDLNEGVTPRILQPRLQGIESSV